MRPNLPRYAIYTLCLLTVFTCLSLHAQTTPTASPTLAAIRAAGSLNCGVDFEQVEYTMQDAHGNHSAFDIGLCQAIAIAALGPHAKFNVVQFRDEQDALEGLRTGKVAVLATASVNFQTTTDTRIALSQPVLYDFQGLLVNKTSNIHSTRDLAGKKICSLIGTEIQNQLQSYMKRQNIAYLPFPFSEEGEMEAAFITRNCDALTADVTQLAFERIAFHRMASEFVILPDVVALDPLAVAYRSDDLRWERIVDWVVRALILAEEAGVTQSNVPQQSASDDIHITRLLGTAPGYWQSLELPDHWAAAVVAATGNYGELFAHTLGPATVMHLDRGPDRLANQGGLLIAAPIR